MNSLSDETLLAIFVWNSRQHLKPIHDPLKTTLATSAVSTRFRRIMLKHPILWTNSFDVSRPLPFLKHVLSPRMGDHPIEALVVPSITPFLMQNHKVRGEIEMYAYHEFPTVNTLFNNPIKLTQFANRLLHVLKLLPQAKTVVLKIPYHGWLMLEMFFEFSIAHLDTLALMRDDGDNDVDMHAEYKTCTVITLSNILRKAQAEWNMRTLRFRGCCVELNSPAFAGLENLYVTQLPTAVAFSSSALVEVLRAMPRLKRVRLIDVLMAVRYPNSVSPASGGLGSSGGGGGAGEEFRHLAQPIALPNLVEFVLWGQITPVGEVVYSLDIPPDCATSVYGKGLTSHRGPDPPILLILHQLRVMFERQQPPPPLLTNVKMKRKSKTTTTTTTNNPGWWNTLVVQMRATTCRVRVWRQPAMGISPVNLNFVSQDATSSSGSGGVAQAPVGLELSFSWNLALSTPSISTTTTTTTNTSAPRPSPSPNPLTHAHTFPGTIPSGVNNNTSKSKSNNGHTSLSRSPAIPPPPRFGGGMHSPTKTPTMAHAQIQKEAQHQTQTQSQTVIPPRIDPTAIFLEVTRSLPRSCDGILALHLEYDLTSTTSASTSGSTSTSTSTSTLTSTLTSGASASGSTSSPELSMGGINSVSAASTRSREGQLALGFLSRFPKVQVLDKISARTAVFLVHYLAFPFDVGGGKGGGTLDVDEKEKDREKDWDKEDFWERERERHGESARERERERIQDPLKSLHTLCFVSVDFTKSYSFSWPGLNISGEGLDGDLAALAMQPPPMELRQILLEYVARRAKNEELPLIREVVFRQCKGISERDGETLLSLGTTPVFLR